MTERRNLLECENGLKAYPRTDLCAHITLARYGHIVAESTASTVAARSGYRPIPPPQDRAINPLGCVSARHGREHGLPEQAHR
jgi:hypothetical protein